MIEVRALASMATDSISVVLTEGAVRFHAGIAYRSVDGEEKILHLADHNKVRAALLSPIWAQIVCAHPIDQDLIAHYCATLAETRPKVPYGLVPKGHFEKDGSF